MNTNKDVEILLKKLNEIARKLNINNDDYDLTDYIKLMNDIIVFSIKKIVDKKKVESLDIENKLKDILELLKHNQ